jgi:hypothetical protein
MVQINFAQKQINAKIVYYGPGMSGKTTNLEVVHQRAPDQNRGDLTSISTDGDRTLFFDFMPLDLGTVAGMRTSFQIYTVPGQVYYNSTRKLVLQGVDGVVFVADSAATMVEENLESLRNLEENLNEYGKSLASLPHVIQFNKRDLPNALPVATLNQQLNKYNAPTYEAVANTGQGVFPTLKALAAAVLDSIHQGGGGSARPAPSMPAPPPAAPMQPASPQRAPAPVPAAPAPAAPAPAIPVHAQQAPQMAPLAPAPQPMRVAQPAAPLQVAAEAHHPSMQANAPTGFHKGYNIPTDPPVQGYHKNVSNTGYNEVYQATSSSQQSATIIDGGLQMATPKRPMGQTTFHGAPPAELMRPAQSEERSAPAKPAPKPPRKPGPLEGTRFKPRARPTAPPATAKPGGGKLFTGLFIAIALVVAAALVGVVFTFF